jgi:hypothetical protein
MSEFEYAERPDHHGGEQGDGHDQVQPITIPRTDRVAYSLGAMSEQRQHDALPPIEEGA